MVDLCSWPCTWRVRLIVQSMSLQLICVDLKSYATPCFAAQGMSEGEGEQAGRGIEHVIANLQTVWELLHNPQYQVIGDAESAWARALEPQGTALVSHFCPFSSFILLLQLF